MRIRCAALVVLVSAALNADPAGAQQPDRATPVSGAAARAHLERGLRYFATQQYTEAIVELRAGYQLEPHADFLYALAQAQRLGGNCRDAIGAYRAFLRASPPEEEASLARGNIEKCETVLRDEEAKREPEPRLAPKATPPADAAAPATPAAAPGERAPFYTDWLGDALCGVGLVGLILGGTFWGLALDRASSADEGTFEEYERGVDAASDLRTAAVISAVAGAGFGVAGIVRFATRPAISVSPAGGVALRARF